MDNNFPRISVVIPSYNQSQFIGQTIRSLLSQNYPDLEVIVQDGGSTDDTVKVLKSFGNKIRWQSKKDKGQSDAINQGLQKTTGQVLAYVNSDDFLLPNVLFEVARSFRQHPRAQWLTGDYLIVDAKNKSRDVAIRVYKSLQRRVMKFLPFLQKPILSINNPMIQPSTFWRREFWQQVGGFSNKLHYTMDYEWWWRAWQIQPPIFTTKKLSGFRIHGQSKGVTQFEKQFSQQLEVAKRFSPSPIWLKIHQWHNQLILWWYRRTK